MVSAVTLDPRPSPSITDAEKLVTSVHEVMRSVLHSLHPVLEAEGISMGQFWSLHLVSSLETASVSVVARHLSVSAPSVCVSIDQLEESGLVVRKRSPSDRRAVELSLTTKGRKVEGRVWAEVGRTMAQAAGALSPKDVATAIRVFQELNRRLGSIGSPAGEAV
ncbi:MAG: MarR family transcriptional regulator [Thermoplasmata archaeon]